MEPSPADNTAPRRRLIVLWAAMTWSVVIYCILAFVLAGGESRRGLPDRLVGPLAFLPYLLPLLLGGAGFQAYQAMALKNAEPGQWGDRPQTEWPRVQTGLIAMLAIFEMNVIVGLLFFFLGAPLGKFLVFAAGTILLNVVGLIRVRSTWPTD